MKLESVLRELEWERFCKGEWYARTKFGMNYSISRVSSSRFLVYNSGGRIGEEPTLKAAKLAATQHYAAKIKSAFKDEVWE